jgi:hypothetical protein
VLLGALSAWYGATTARHLTHGAGGSDPFAYLQMTADIVEHGTAEHLFPLAAVARGAGVPVWPVVPVGYLPPALDRAATVWPPWWSAMLAPLYAVGGEPLALWGAPLCLLAAGWLTWRLARIVIPEPHVWPAVLAVGLVLTSFEAVTRSLVPMADAAATALGLALLVGLVRARRTDALGWSVMAGAAWGLTYDVRHPQILLGMAALPALLASPWPWGRRLAHIALFGGAALLLATPDLVYHARVLSSPWATESGEWALISWRHIGGTLRALGAGDALRRNEWGYLWPLVLVGVWKQLRLRDERWLAAVLWAGFGPVLLFHLFYQALRLRDLLPLFPWLALLAARGVAALWTWARRSRVRRWAAVVALAMTLSARAAHTLTLPWVAGVSVFGHMTVEQRAAFAALDEALPDGAVVATGLSSGAVERYARHLALRPAAWTKDEWRRFASALVGEGYALYALDDGEEMAAWCAGTGDCSRAELVGSFAIPTFGLGGQDAGRLAGLWRLGAPLP